MLEIKKGTFWGNKILHHSLQNCPKLTKTLKLFSKLKFIRKRLRSKKVDKFTWLRQMSLVLISCNPQEAEIRNLSVG